MRFFPRDAFKNLTDTPVHMPDTQVQFQQFQQMQHFQQQIWQQMGMPMTVSQSSIGASMFLYKLRILALRRALALQMALQTYPLQMHPRLADPAWYLLGLGGFGYSSY